MVKKIFRKQKAIKNIVSKTYLAIDIENNAETGAFINAGVFGEIADHHGRRKNFEHVFHTQKELFAFLEAAKTKEDKNSPFVLTFFNLAYDYPFLQDICDDSKLLMVGGRFIAGALNNGIKLVDIKNQATDGSLEDWIKWIKMKDTHGIEKAPLPSVTDTMKEWDARVLPDAKATWVLTEYMQSFYNNKLNIPLTLTLGSGARRFFSQYFFTDYWIRDNDKLDSYERESYRGGRTEVFQRGKHRVFSYDVNSMYLSVMRDEIFPDPTSAKIFEAPPELPHDKMYIAKCKVTVPNQHIPPLPLFKDKLIFPVGSFTGVWCSPELEYAIRECGVKVEKIEWCITYRGKPYFREIAEYVWTERIKYPKSVNYGMNLMIKKIGNSLYGGFGQKNELYTYAGKLEDFDADLSEGVKPIITERDGVKFVTVSGGDKEDSEHTFTCVPSFITSYARLKFLEKARAHPHSVVYGDTDSLKFDRNLHSRYQNGLGEWGYEPDKSGKWYFHKPKMYGKHRNGMPEKIKGIRKDALIVRESKDMIEFIVKRPNRYKESIKRGLVMDKWESNSKTVNKLDDKRVWILGSMQSEPICVIE